MTTRVDKLRVLWVFRHRTARYEEVNALLRAGAEVIPISGELSAFPNAVQLAEEDDPWYPRWRETCTVPDDALKLLRDCDYYRLSSSIPPDVASALRRWIDVVVVGTFPRLALAFHRAFPGTVVLRPYGGYPYTSSLGPWPFRKRALDVLGSSSRYIWCPALPYQSLVEDPRLCRSEVFWPATVDSSRLAHVWRSEHTEPVICEVISLIDRYRRDEYARFMSSYGDLPIRIFGQNPRRGARGDQPWVIGTLLDDEYYAGISTCRAMLYQGLGSKYHLHYHAIEALMMGVPVLFFHDSGLAHTALYLGMPLDELIKAGLCTSEQDARARAKALLSSPEEAEHLSRAQEPLRDMYRPERWDCVAAELLTSLVRRRTYATQHTDASDRPPSCGVREIASMVLNIAYARASPVLKWARSHTRKAWSFTNETRAAKQRQQ